MASFNFIAFLPELVLLAGALVLFFICLGEGRTTAARRTALLTAAGAFVAVVVCGRQEALLFDGAFQVDPFSQLLKAIVAVGFGVVTVLSGRLDDLREDIRPEYYLFLVLHVCGQFVMVSSVELITLVTALETAAFPLFLMVPMRREGEGRRAQMEAAMKYFMFGVAATGVMLFGMSYLFGITGSTNLAQISASLQTQGVSPLAVAAVALTCCGLFYKLAVFPFHYWTPDVYQGAATETTALVASLPKIGAVAVLARFVALAGPESQVLALLMSGLAVVSMFYGNLGALWQTDLKRLFAFSGIAHGGYALIGFVAFDNAGSAAALFYITGYVFMVLACFLVVAKISPDGVNANIEDLAGLHRRSPLLAVTLLVGVFGLAGVPPFAGFMGKLTLLTAALAQGHLWLVVLAVVNTAIAIYYYLSIVRETCFREATRPALPALDWPTRAACVVLIGVTLALGVAPAPVLERLTAAVPALHAQAPAAVATPAAVLARKP